MEYTHDPNAVSDDTDAKGEAAESAPWAVAMERKKDFQVTYQFKLDTGMMLIHCVKSESSFR